MREAMGQIIRRLRKERNLTQEELAEQLNITYQAVSRWENGAGMPDISQIVPLSNVFGVTTDVLFGKDGRNEEEEIAAFIRETERRRCNRPQDIGCLEWEEACCEEVQKMLEVYPGNYALLAYSLGSLCCLIEAYAGRDEADRQSGKIQGWERECIRQANVILGRCTDIRYLNSANKWMAVFYRNRGEYVKMLEYAERLTVFDPYAEGGDWLASAYDLLGRKEDSRRQNARNISKILGYLQSQLQLIGASWEEEGRLEEAYTCYRLYPDFYDLLAGEREEEMPFCTNLYQDQCALICMRLNRREEAMDWLEKMVRHQRRIARSYNVITEAAPYLYGQERHTAEQAYRRADRLLPIFAWRIFDPIRETDRFQAILADAAAFEGGQ